MPSKLFLGIHKRDSRIRLMPVLAKKQPDPIIEEFGGYRWRPKTPNLKLNPKKITKGMTHQISPSLKD